MQVIIFMITILTPGGFVIVVSIVFGGGAFYILHRLGLLEDE